ncbi:MAG: hypothetical protein A2V93_01395 [Ignavibacteria bacterium RBG_16_34_14]|nr:MAG: hypothetical protein A2V93_01395 [Ignavibacteria bacterium RBG_16_34_14]
MNRTIIYFFIFFTFLSSFSVLNFAQCSDAGVCQLGHLADEKEEQLNISVTYKNGYSGKEDDVSFNSIQLETTYELFNNSTVKILLPYNFKSGPGGNVKGIGDLIISWTQELFSNEASSLNASLGAKLATGDENKEHSLPQIYQPGLGSNDFIFTVDYNNNNFGFGTGYQLAGGRNDKEGLRLKRGDDLLLKASYLFSSEYFKIIPQLIFIKRLSKSSILDINSPGENFIEVDKSDQSQFNLLALVQYNLNENYDFFSEVAIPLLKREVNVDGLTRTYTVSFGMRFIIN